MPPEVVSIRLHRLTQAEYGALAESWRAYRDEHSESAVAEVQLGRALRYAGAPAEEVRRHYARALEIGPDCPEALDTAASTFLGEWEPLAADAADCYALGLRAVALAPNWPEPRFTLWPLALLLGKLQEADEHLTAMVTHGGIPAPVLDYCYNMLVGTEPDAIIFTNGDNDTYGCCALQAAYGIRRDVQVINLSLINQEEIEENIFARFPAGKAPLTASGRREMHAEFRAHYLRDRELYSTKVMKTVAAHAAAGAWPNPVYFAATIPASLLETCPQPRRLEGLLWRTLLESEAASATRDGEGATGPDRGVDVGRTRELFTTAYRLDSVTDYSFPWSTHNSVAGLMDNYHAVLFKVAFAAAEAGDSETMRFAFARGLTMAAFHGRTETVANMARYWLEMDPDNPEAQNWTTQGD